MKTTEMAPEKTTRGRAHSSQFRKFFINQLKEIYWAEKHLLAALPKLQRAATDAELAAAFEKHMKETEWQIQMIETIFGLMGRKPDTKKCDSVEGLLKEIKSVIEDTENDSYTRDAGLILAAQKIKHYEIATYGTLRIFAAHMDENEVKRHLEKILDNEKETDVYLTKIAEYHINEYASEE